MICAATPCKDERKHSSKKPLLLSQSRCHERVYTRLGTSATARLHKLLKQAQLPLHQLMLDAMRIRAHRALHTGKACWTSYHRGNGVSKSNGRFSDTLKTLGTRTWHVASTITVIVARRCRCN